MAVFGKTLKNSMPEPKASRPTAERLTQEGLGSGGQGYRKVNQMQQVLVMVELDTSLLYPALPE